jgi:hypothetical protein
MKTIFDDVRCVKVDGCTVMLCFRGNFPDEAIYLLDDDKKTIFEPFTPLNVSGSQTIMQPRKNLVAAIRRGKEILPVDTCKIVVNGLDDWFVNGHDTLQVELSRGNAPFLLTFPEKLELDGGGAPLLFKAYVASHHLRATLRLEFTDMDNGRTAVEEVHFAPDFFGGKSPENYQYISVPVPAKMHHVSIEISIRYLGDTDPGSPYPPFAFLYGLCLSTISNDADESKLFDETDLQFEWLAATLKNPCKALECLFVQCGETISVLPTDAVKNARAFFSESYYEAKNSEVDFSLLDSFSHYLMIGWKEYRNPSPEFSAREYLLRHPEVEIAGTEPLIHYANLGQERNYSLGVFEEKLAEIWRSSGEGIPALPEMTIFARAQDMMIPLHLINTRKLAVFLVPEHNAMSGGIYSIFSIADHVRRTRSQHGFDVLVMTRPNSQRTTYIRNSSFKNSETVYRFEQLRLFSELSELQLHIPEYATVEFARSLSLDLMHYLLRRDHVHINILNQNTRLMPEPRQFRDLRHITDSIGQSVSHHAFFGQEFADHYNLPSLLLPAYTDLTPYPPVDFEEKESLIIYSDDDAPYRRAVLDQLATLGDYELVKIKDMTFDTYMDLATRCRFSVSFGEGFDGYVAQPMYQGGIGMALYTDEFFPDESYKDLENFFETEDEMITQIVPTIRRLEADRQRYKALNAAMRRKWDELYSYDDYVARIGKLIRREYEVYPSRNDQNRKAGRTTKPA